MSTLLLDISLKVAGEPVDADALPALADADGTYGVQRTDSGAVVVAAGTAMVRDGLGLYSYTLADAVAGVTYAYVVRVVYRGRTHYVPKTRTAAFAATAPSYLTIEEANAIAAVLPDVPAFLAATNDERIKGLHQGTFDIDNAMRYQGRRYDAAQVLEFPRTPHGPSLSPGSALPAAWLPSPQTVWDWDDATQTAVVPLKVKHALVYQADAILGGTMKERLDKQHEGLAYDQTGAMAESYKKEGAQGYSTGITRRAYQLMRTYAVRTGELL